MLTKAILNATMHIFRRLPVKSGLTALSFNPVTNKLMAGVPSIAKARLRDGHWIEVSTADYHGRILYLFGTNDPKVEQTATELLGKGDVFLDIGANYSSIGLAASHIVGPTGLVHLFEPQKQLGDRVQAAIEAGPYTNVRLHRVGLMDCDSMMVLQSPTSHSGMATFADHEATGSFDHVEECQVKEIASYAAPLVAGVTFGAKLDIEGAEPKVMPWLLAQPNLSFLIFEAAHNQSELFESVRSAGLALFGLERNILKLRLIRIDNFSEVALFHDLVAARIPDGIAPKKLTALDLGRLIALSRQTRRRV